MPHRRHRPQPRPFWRHLAGVVALGVVILFTTLREKRITLRENRITLAKNSARSEEDCKRSDYEFGVEW